MMYVLYLILYVIPHDSLSVSGISLCASGRLPGRQRRRGVADGSVDQMSRLKDSNVTRRSDTGGVEKTASNSASMRSSCMWAHDSSCCYQVGGHRH